MLSSPAVLVALTLAVALNVHVVAIVYPYDDDRLLQLIALAVIAALGMARPWLRESIAARLYELTPSWRLLGLACSALALLSAATAPVPWAAFAELGLFLLLGGAALSIGARSPRSSGDDDLAATGLILFAGICAYEIQFLAAYSASLLGAAPLLPRELFPGFATPRFLGQIQTWTLPLAVLPLLLLHRLSLPWRGLLFLVPSLWWTMALTTGGRGTLAASILAVLAVAALFRRRAGRWLMATVASATAGLLLYWLLFILLPAGGPETGGTAYGLTRGLTQTSGRIALWDQALELIRSAPLLGVGPMHYACLELSGARTAHPHNTLLQLASEWGIPFTLIVVGGAIPWAGRWLRWATGPAVKDRSMATVVIALGASVIGAAAHAMLSGIIVMPLSQILAVLVLGAMLRFRHTETEVAIRPSATSIVAIPAGLAVFALLSVATSLVPLLEQYTTQVDPRGIPTWLMEPPRFWKAGDICSGTAP